MDEKGLGVRLQEARKAAGLTQQELCQKSGLSYSTLAKIERGAIKSPSIFTIQQIAASLQTTVDALLGIGSTTPTKQRSKTGISFVYFDVNGCLVHWMERSFSLIAADTGVPSDLVQETYLRYNSSVCRGDMPMAEFNATLADSFEVESFDWSQYYLKAISSIGPATELLHWVSKYYQVGLLTNIMPGLLDTMRAQGLIPDVSYDAIVDSSVVGSIKPERLIYDYAAQHANVEPSSILLIDDTLINLEKAEKVGWQTLHFDDTDPVRSVQTVKKTLEF